MSLVNGHRPNPWAGDETVQAEVVPSDDAIDNPMVPSHTGLGTPLGNQQAYQWRTIRRSQTLNGVLGVAVLGLSGVCVWLATQVTILPYVIEVAVPDAPPGQVRGISPLPAKLPPQLMDNVALWLIEIWVTHLRVLHDRAAGQAQYLNWETAYYLTEHVMYPRLDEYTNEQKARMRQGEAVEIKKGSLSILPIHARERSYKAEWVERVIGMGGHVLREELWQATIVLSYRPPGPMTPKEMDARQRSPVGLFVHEFSWMGKETKKGASHVDPKTNP